ncbi:beta-ketoacyl-ACP synthase III [Amycolatopsis cihanbeyliensis]|uniref:Beta-ketoacyl-[acyl-carrier-protein] synthase III n=1 Tax=Amycolatopsis cihanbeyliensis TaxID=1128664 RepID=A0A542DBM0_AMYCI|nr:beta-ketoacyl-ACP synthase III [Amycolatopsis cihanbeyliensis]TQJ00453.1 3-oxoacyl-[acyl-carrier-protein] synthase-3 [Amycolatopsis cihanbeyliensis]
MAAVITGLGSWLPSRVVTNEDLCANLDTTDEWITTRTGIRERRMVTGGLSTRDLAVEAGARALKSADESTVDAVVVSTTSFDRLCPAVAPEVAHLLGVDTVAAFDLTSACSGFPYGLATSAGLIAAGVARKVLLIGAEAFTTLVDPGDRNTAPIFGDGAGAVVLRAGEPDEPGALGPFDLGSDGAHADLLAIPAGGSRQRSARNGLGFDTVPTRDWYLQMAGRPLFVQAVERMTTSTRRVLDRIGWSAADVDWFVGHQANVRIVRAVAEELQLPEQRVAVNIDRVGNTLAASIPLLLNDIFDRGGLEPGQRVLLSAFGAGLSWGSTALVWPDIPIDAVS